MIKEISSPQESSTKQKLKFISISKKHNQEYNNTF